MEKIIDIFELGGPMMLPLALLAAAGALIFLERLLYLHTGQIRAVEFVAGIKTALKRRRLLEAVTICDESYGPIPRVVKAALLNSEEPPETMSQAVNIAAANEFALIDRRVSSLALVAKLSPLVGLADMYVGFRVMGVGTVLAILQIFRTMASSGSYASAAEFSGQIYNALLSSAAGLFIAILAWLGYALINSRVRALAQDIDWSANDIMLFIIRGMPENENLQMEGGDAK